MLYARQGLEGVMRLATLYVATSEPSWLARTEVPLLVPHHRLMRRVTLPRSPRAGSWALDSGGFNHLRKHGTWTITPERYVADVVRIDREVGNLAWSAPMDWMCEADALAATGLTVLEHQRRTVENFVTLQRLWYEHTDRESPFMPTLQGDPDAPPDECVASYLRCWDLYGEADIDLRRWPSVGLGSICRQQSTAKIGLVVEALQERDGERELPLHGYGCKSLGLQRYGHLLASADSSAYSKHARYKNVKWPGCPETHSDCRNCFHYALAWRRALLAKLGVYDTWNAEQISEIDWILERMAEAENFKNARETVRNS
jgi:hypothetical protein